MGRQFDAHEEQTFTWCNEVQESLLASNSKPLDWQFYLGLELPISKRLYRFLDKRFHLGSKWKYECRGFGINKLGMSDRYDASEYKRKMRPGIDELVAKGFLAEQATRDLFRKVGKGVYEVNFRRAAKRKRAVEHVPTELEQALLDRGIKNARELVSKYPAEKIQSQIEKLRRPNPCR